MGKAVEKCGPTRKELAGLLGPLISRFGEYMRQTAGNGLGRQVKEISLQRLDPLWAHNTPIAVIYKLHLQQRMPYT